MLLLKPVVEVVVVELLLLPATVVLLNHMLWFHADEEGIVLAMAHVGMRTTVWCSRRAVQLEARNNAGVVAMMGCGLFVAVLGCGVCKSPQLDPADNR